MNGTLHFGNVQKEDEGQYTCIAVNSQGEINVVIHVEVVGACRNFVLIFVFVNQIEYYRKFMYFYVNSHSKIHYLAKESDRRL